MTLGARLGEGGFGVVYKAKWRNDDVEVKQIRPDLVQGNAVRAREEFRTELQQLFSLPMIVQRWARSAPCKGAQGVDQSID